MSWQHYGSFTLAKFVGKNVSDNTKEYLPWPPWATRQKIETILSLLLHRPRTMVTVAVAGVIVLNFANVNMAYLAKRHLLLT
jgi:hypothetical protein